MGLLTLRRVLKILIMILHEMKKKHREKKDLFFKKKINKKIVKKVLAFFILIGLRIWEVFVDKLT